LLALLISATSATAQAIALEQPDTRSAPAWRWTIQPASAIEKSNFAPRPSEQYNIEASRGQQRGLMVGTKVGPAATIGVGLMTTKPRKSALSPDPVIAGRARGSRKAAVRLIVKF
jgi:hypothetical protein